MEKRKIKIMYFYSDLYESARKLSRLSKRIREEIRGIKIHLVNVEDSSNDDITELYGVSAVPVMIFLTSEGEVAARKSASLSDVKVIHEITERINRGELPDLKAEKLRAKILEIFNNVTQRSDLTQLIVDQIRNDILEADTEAEIYDLINSHISLINHTVCDLQQFKLALQRFSRKKPDFLV